MLLLKKFFISHLPKFLCLCWLLINMTITKYITLFPRRKLQAECVSQKLKCECLSTQGWFALCNTQLLERWHGWNLSHAPKFSFLHILPPNTPLYSSCSSSDSLCCCCYWCCKGCVITCFLFWVMCNCGIEKISDPYLGRVTWLQLLTVNWYLQLWRRCFSLVLCSNIANLSPQMKFKLWRMREQRNWDFL